MDIRDMHVGCFYTITEVGLAVGLTVEKAYEAVSIHLEGHLVEVVGDRGRHLLVAPRRFRLPTKREVFAVGARVKLLYGGDMDDIPDNPGWAEESMDEMVGHTYTITRQTPDHEWVKFENDEFDFVYDFAWLERVTVNDPEGDQEYAIEIAPMAQGAVGMGDVAPHRIDILAAQPVLKAEFKAGDYVRIARKVEQNAKYTIRWTTSGDMDKLIGTVGIIKSINWNGGLRIGMYNYLPECVDKISKEEYDKATAKPVKKKKKSVRQVVAEIRKTAKDYADLGTCSYVIVYETDKGDIAVKKQFTDACHYRLQVDGWYGIEERVAFKKAITVLDFIHDVRIARIPKELQSAAVKYADYIVNRSPFSRAYIKKTGKNVVANGAEIDVSAPADIVAAGCIALRMMREQQNSLRMFEIARKAGISEHAAFILMHAYTKAKPDGNVTVSRMEGHHSVLHNCMSAKELFSFFANGYSKKVLDKPAYSTHTTYSVENSIATKTALAHDHIRSWLTEHVPTQGDAAGWGAVQTVQEAAIIAAGKELDNEIAKAKK